jgi:tRNA pseudouridine38-40 synthase
LATRYALLVTEPLDVDAMNTVAHCLIGKHDFGAFGTPPHGDNTVRTMLRAEVRRDGPAVWIDLQANAFLYRMVRRIVGTLLWVGKGQIGTDEFRQIMAKRRRAGQSVPPQGLCLVAVDYER